MLQKIFQNLFVVLMLVLLFLPAITKAEQIDMGLNEVNNAFLANNGLVNTNPQTVSERIINTVLGFLGLIAVVIILLGGFKWMTSGGSEEKVSKAKKLLGAGIVGLVIIIAAWGITSYVISTMVEATV